MNFNSSQSSTLTNVSNATFNPLSLTDDFFSPLINIGFNFTFYGNSYSSCVLSSNNFISFNSSNANTTCVFTATSALGPSSPPDLKNTILAPFQDINPQTTGNIEYATIGTAPNRAFVARWYDIPMFNCASLTFCSAVIFYESSNIIETHLINKPNCSWQNGLAIHGLLNSTGNQSEVVYDADEMVDRNYGNQWTTSLEGTRFTPSGTNNYNVTSIDFLPIVSLATSEYEDNLGNTYPLQQITNINNVPGLNRLIATSTVCSSSLRDTVYITGIETDILIDGNLVNSISKCADDTVELSVKNSTDFDSFLWSTGETTASIEVVPAGIYSVTSTINGCDINSQVTVTNLANYEINLGEDTVICQSQTFQLNATTINSSSYLWDNGTTTPFRTINTTGTYIVNGVSNNGCKDADTINVTVLPDPILDLGIDLEGCIGDEILIGDSINGATYSWNNGESSPFINVSTNGLYILTSSIGNCSEIDSIHVNFFDNPTINLDSIISICDGDTALIDAFHSQLASYEWHNGDTTSTYSSTETELVWVTVSLHGCTFTDSVQIIKNPIPEFYLGNDTTLCENDTLTLTVPLTGGIYLWNTTEITQSISVTQTGSYYVDYTINNCTYRDTIDIIFNTNPTISLGNDTIGCLGDSIIFNAFYNSNATYQWHDGSTNATYTSGSSEEIWVNVLLNNCEFSDTVNTEFHNLPQPNLGNDTILCTGEVMTLQDSIIGATYLWSTGQTSSSISVSTTGEYWLKTIIGVCSKIDTIQITFAETPIINLGADINSCTGDTTVFNAFYNSASTYLWNDGTTNATQSSFTTETLWVTVTLGNCNFTDTVEHIINPYPITNLGPDYIGCLGDPITLHTDENNATYLWNTGDTTQNYNPTVSGIYSVEVTKFGCTSFDTIQVTLNEVPTINLGNSIELCEGDSTTLNAFYNPTATYLWQDGSTNSTYTSNSSELVWVTVSLANCSFSDSVNITVNEYPLADLGPDITLCENDSVTLFVDESNASYLWNTGDTTQSIIVNTTDYYSIQVTKNGCISYDTVSVIFNVTPTINLGSDIDLCEGDSTTLNAYYNSSSTYLWHDGSTNANYTSNSSELVWVTITLANCSFTDSINITVNPYPITNLGTDIIVCENDPVTLTVVEPNANYLWNTGDTTQSISPLITNTYTVQVTKFGCTSYDTISVVFNETPIINLGTDIDLCDGDSTTLNAFYNSSSTYLWQDGSTSSTYTSNSSELVWVTVSLNNCSFTDSINITEHNYPIIDLGLDQIVCEGDSLVLEIDENNAEYLWSTGDTSKTITVIQTGIFTAQVTKNGCSSFDTINVLFNPIPTINLGLNTELCEGDSTTFNAFYNSSATYLWQNGSTNSTYTSLTSETIWVTVYLENCSYTDTVINTVYPYPIADLGTDIEVCENIPVSLTVPEVGAQYLWNTGDTTQTIQALISGQYYVKVTKNGCDAFDTISVTLKPIPVVNIGSDTTICEGDSIIFDAYYSPSTTYLWQDGSTNSTYTGFQSENISVDLTLNGCTFNQILQLTVNPLPIINLNQVYEICDGDSLNLDVYTTSSATYLWSTTNNTSKETFTTAGNYSVTIYDNGCESMKDFKVIVHNVPSQTLENINICKGESEAINAYDPSIIAYNWSTGETTPSIEVSTEDWYWVDLSNANCTTRDSFYLTVEDVPIYYLPKDTFLCEDKPLILSVHSEFSTFLWNNGSTDSSILINELGLYSVTVTNACGVRIDTIKVFPGDCACPIFAPNALNLNSSSTNSSFQVITDCGDFSTYELTIFNRWGKQVFQTTDPLEPWRPLAENTVNQDVYVYKLKYGFLDSFINEKIGEIILLH